MTRGKRTTGLKHDLWKELCDQINLATNPSWFGKGSTITADAVESALIKIAEDTGIPPKHLHEYQKYIWRLLHKSISAIVLSLEIINKPSIPYRIESFLFLLLNAWELLLKARIINIERSINEKRLL